MRTPGARRSFRDAGPTSRPPFRPAVAGVSRDSCPPLRPLLDAAAAGFLGSHLPAVWKATEKVKPSALTFDSNVEPRTPSFAAAPDGLPASRQAGSEEIAEAILFLASDKAAFKTGATLAADGGTGAPS